MVLFGCRKSSRGEIHIAYPPRALIEGESRPQSLQQDRLYLSHLATVIIPDTSIWHDSIAEDSFV
jgi:hypothetical protein